MSSLIVEVCRVEEVKPHPDADRMAIAKIKGWYVCVNRPLLPDGTVGEPWAKVGDKVVYFPPDCILQADVSDKFGVTNYLAELGKNEDGTRPSGRRVKVANLRGQKSYGFAAPLDDPTWEVGKDVAAYYNVSKYEPPLRCNQGDAESPHPAFHRYYSMENIRNFMDVFTDGEPVVVTEKIHGENCRLGLIRDTDDNGVAVWRWMAGTHDVRRKKFWQKRHKETGELVGEPQMSAPWMCFTPEVRKLLVAASGCGYTPEELDNSPPVRGHDGQANIVLFGERFGSGIQDMAYGHEAGKFSFRAFDMTLDGQYLGYDAKVQSFKDFGVEAVPEVYRGPYSFAKIEELAEGPTLVTDKAGKKNFREGVVVLAEAERRVVTPTKVMDRAQLKCISFTYLNRKDGTEFH